MKTIDAKGKLCPVPLIMTKKALGEIQDTETLVVLIDNETSMKNVVRMLEEHHMNVKTEQNGNEFKLTIVKTGEIPETTNAEEFCSIENRQISDYVVAFQRNKMGDGDDTLGTILMKAFINTLPEMDRKPNKMVFLNAGIYLALKDSQVIESLQKLENMGTEIHVCGTCLDFYGKKEELAAGRVSNMYDILDVLSKSPSVLYP